MFKELEESEKSLYKINKRLCPDMVSLKDQLRVKNSYSDNNERISFSLQAVTCNNQTEDCEDS